MASLNPTVPVKASHRFLRKLLSITLSGKVEQVPSELDKVSRVFREAGGRWEGIFKGSPRDIALMKQVVKVAYEEGHLTRKEKWDASG
jgi:hypothetical protein